MVVEAWPEAATAIAPEADVFAAFLSCNRSDLGVRAGVHESVHAIGGPNAAGEVRLPQPGREALVLIPIATQPATRVAARLRETERTGFHDAYLAGDAGKQGLTYLLDELNAYVWTLELARRLQGTRPLAGERTSDRDALAAMQWFVLLYLDELAIRDVSRHAAVAADGAHREALTTLFEDRAGESLEGTCGDPHLGIEDGYWLRQVYGPEGRRMYREATGRELSLPEACAPVVAGAAAELRTDRAGQSQQSATFTRTITRDTFTITVNGEPVSVEQIEARAATDPEWGEVLEQVRAQLGDTP